ncbi:MAG TPA: hypothetical protein VFS87_05890 [Qipengyuania sp.]|nr:hypothetical protein [Qipengyuania sp.]
MSHPIDAPTTTPGHGWTRERKALFLDRLAAHGNARAACRAVGLSAEAAYKLRRRDPLFARAWAAAVVLGRDASIQALAERAVEGIEEEIYYRGELIGTRRRYDSRLLLAHLARLDKLADEDAAGADAGRFDELVADVAKGTDDVSELTRHQHIEDAAKCAEDRLRREETNAYYDSLEEDDGAKDSGYWDPPLDEDFEDELDRKCADLAERTREVAAEGWDSRQRQVFASVDALVATSEAQSSVPNPPHAAVLNILSESGVAASQGTERSFPCTLSTASTTALARTLAEPPPGWATMQHLPPAPSGGR